MRYKIINTDNFDGDYPDEYFINIPSLSKENAKNIADILNKECSGYSASRYWKVVEEGYTLRPGFEP